MAEFIENRPVTCNVCGAYPIYGQESTYRDRKDIVRECRWVCSRCTNLVRVDENRTHEEPKTN